MLVLNLGPFEVTALAFGPDGRTLVTPLMDGLRVWDDAASGADPRTASTGKYWPLGPLTFTADGLRIGCHWKDGLLVCRTDGRGEPTVIRRSVPAGDQFADAMIEGRITPDGAAVVVCEYIFNTTPSPHAFTRIALLPLADRTAGPATWEVTTEGVILDDPLVVDGEITVLERVHNASKHRFEAVLVARDLATGALVRTSKSIKSGPTAPVASPDGGTVVCTHGKKLVVWGGDWTAAPREVVSDTKKHFTGMAFHPSGRYLAATSNDKTVKFFDTTTWTVAKTYTWNVGRMRCVAVSPDGALAAAGSDTGKVVVWDVDV